MKYVRFLLLSGICLLSQACGSGSEPYYSLSSTFLQHMMQEDYDACVEMMALDHPRAAGTNIDTLKLTLRAFRRVLRRDFGDSLQYEFINTERAGTQDSFMVPEGTTLARIQFDNGRGFGVVEALFDDQTQKIIEIYSLDFQRPVPDQAPLRLFRLAAGAVVVFNLLILVWLYRSSLPLLHKALLTPVVVLLNVPTIGYKLMAGFFFKPLEFQYLLGAGMTYQGFINHVWRLGIPVGGIAVALYLLVMSRRKSPPAA